MRQWGGRRKGGDGKQIRLGSLCKLLVPKTKFQCSLVSSHKTCHSLNCEIKMHDQSDYF